MVPEVRVAHLLSRDEAGRFPFQMVAGDAVVRALGGPDRREAPHDRSSTRRSRPSLPLLLWKTPPGLELILAQEGVPFEVVRDPHPLVFRGGRFVLFDGRTTSAPVAVAAC